MNEAGFFEQDRGVRVERLAAEISAAPTLGR